MWQLRKLLVSLSFTQWLVVPQEGRSLAETSWKVEFVHQDKACVNSTLWFKNMGLFFCSFKFIEAMYFQCRIVNKQTNKHVEYQKKKTIQSRHKASLYEIISKHFVNYTCSPVCPTSGARWGVVYENPLKDSRQVVFINHPCDFAKLLLVCLRITG